MKIKNFLLAIIITFSAAIPNVYAQNNVCFTSSTTYTVSGVIASIQSIKSDFNNDGLIDSAWVSMSDGYISVILNDTSAVTHFSLPANGAASIINADFNNDGNQDLAVANYFDNSVSVLLGNGSGQFDPHVDFAYLNSYWLIAEDFNNDGKIDLGVADYSKTNIMELINTVPFITITATDTILCLGQSVSITATGATSYTFTGGITNNTPYAPIITTSYIVTGLHLGCSNTSEITIVVNPLPTATFTTKNESYFGYCDGSIKANLAIGTNIQWPDLSISDSIGSLCPNSYTVNLTDTNSCTNSYTQTILSGALPSAPSICIVKVDSTHTYNVLTWVKTGLDMTTIDSFIVYRETSTNNYSQIGFVLKDSLSTFSDHAVDPSATGYRYKLKSKSVLNVESAFSDYHNTIHLTNTGANFLWTPYLVENNITPVSIYNVYRDDISTGNFQLIGYTTGNQFGYTVGNFSSFPYASYYVEAVTYSSPCYPSRSGFETSVSNIRFIGTTGAMGQYKKSIVNVYPNPTKGIINITGIGSKTTLFIYNIVGEVVLSKEVNNDTTLDISALNEGIYTLEVNGIYHKIIKN